MERNKLLIANYLDILFDGRNKAYGGYELRTHYANRARKATLGVIMGVALAAAMPMLADALAGKTPLPPPVVFEHPYELADIPKPVLPPPMPLVEPPPPVAVIRNPELRIVDPQEVTEAPPTVDEVRNAQVGLETHDGPLTASGIIPTGPAGTGDRVVEAPQPPKEETHRIVEQMPQFEGDLEKYLQRNLRYPESAQQVGIEGTVGVQFIVNEDGSISSVEIIKKVSSALDAEAARVVSAMPKWKPGKQQGRAVKVYFKLPIRFVLQ